MKTIYKHSTDATALAALNHLAKSLGLTPQPGGLSGFAEACYDDNSVDELIEALGFRSADPTDCKNWSITPTQWRNAIREALEQRLYDAIEEITK